MPANEAYTPKKKKKKQERGKFTYYSVSTFEAFMTLVAASIEKDGWKTFKQGGYTTADRAWDNLWHYKHTLWPNKQNEKTAKRAVRWASSLSDKEASGDYLKKIRRIARHKLFNIQTFRHAASIINAYNKMIIGMQFD